MERKYRQLQQDQYGLYQNAYASNPGGDLAGKGTWLGHIEQYEGLRLGLKRLVDQALAKGCVYDPEANVWINQPAPVLPN